MISHPLDGTLDEGSSLGLHAPCLDLHDPIPPYLQRQLDEGAFIIDPHLDSRRRGTCRSWEDMSKR